MNILKKVAALLLVGVMVFSFAACHEKGEIAVTVKDGDLTEQFTSATYLFALMTADSEASNKVQEQWKEAEIDTSKMTMDNVYASKIEDKSYTTWVRDRAKEILVEYAAYKIKCDQNEVKLDEDDLKSTEDNAQIYWSYYGYQSLYEPNGISYDTFKKATVYPLYSNAYFEFVYGEGGEKEIAKADILKAMDENFVTANVIEVDLSSKKDDEAKKIRDKFNSYVSRLKKGEKFETIYNEYYEIKENTTSSNTSGSSSSKVSSTDPSSDATSSEAEKVLEPKDAYASLLGDDDTDYASDHFDTVKAMKKGEIKLIDDTKNKKITLLIAGDMMNDEYWTENLTTVVMFLLKGEEFEKAMDEYMNGLDVDVDGYATKRFKVKDLYKYSE